MEKPAREPVFWSCTDGENLIHDEPDDAIEDALDSMLHPNMTPAEVLAALPKVITVTGYARMVPEIPTYAAPLECLLEALNEEYGPPDDEPNAPTQKMQEAEAAFIATVLAEYEPWACEEVCSEEINVEVWVREHNPEWIGLDATP